MTDPWGGAVRYEPVAEVNVRNSALSPGGAAATYAYSAMFMALRAVGDTGVTTVEAAGVS